MNPLRVLFLSLFIFILFSSFFFSTTPDWVLQKNENGIAVYTRYQTGSSIKEIRVVNTVASSLSGMVALLFDTENYPNWIYACMESKQLKVVSEKELYNYQITDVPWPFSDRDVITHFKVEQDSVTKIITFIKTGVPDFIPEKELLVRVRRFESTYHLIPIGHDSVKVDMEMQIDPGGSIPAWLINANIVAAPYKTTEAMVSQLPQYQSTSYSFIREK